MGITNGLPGSFESSSEEEKDDTIRRTSRERHCQTPFKGDALFWNFSVSTPATVMQMTPSPIRSPLAEIVSTPRVASSRAPETLSNASFFEVQQGFLKNSVSTALFRDPTPSRKHRKRTSSRRSRLSQSLLLDNYQTPKSSQGMERRRSSCHRQYRSFGYEPSPGNSSPDMSSMDSTPESSPSRTGEMLSRATAFNALDITLSSSHQFAKGRRRSIVFVWGFLVLAVSSCLGMICLTRSAVKFEQAYEASRPDAPVSAAGLRGQMTSGHWDAQTTTKNKSKTENNDSKQSLQRKRDLHKHHPSLSESENAHVQAKHASLKQKKSHHQSNGNHRHEHHAKISPSTRSAILPKFRLPPALTISKEQKFESQDPNMYSQLSSKQRRVVALDPSNMGTAVGPMRSIKLHPADFTDNTQLYSVLDSSDERLGHMELRAPYSQGECVPMQDWQTTFHPSCNGMHEIALEQMGEDNGNGVNLFGVKGFWRYAWRLDMRNVQKQDTIVLKTLKFQHNFEDAHFEHDRIDAVAMERLTSSPHVINVFGFCGHSVLTEYADGSRVGELADKSKKKPLVLLKIARDIARGLADVHGIDGDGNATFVHLDVNPANVVSVGGTLKLNDFNIGIIRRWNTTSNTPCGFPAQYPNPQWRSPEEARNEQNLTEKVDVFSMGHIFFRLICGHEPWNKLEPGGRPSKEQVSSKVRRGDLPFIPEHVTNSENPAVIAIRDAMLSCYTFDPVQRPSARDIANSLDQALDALTSNGSYETQA